MGDDVSHTNGASRKGMRCLIVGAGEAGRTLVRDLRQVRDFGLVPIGFLDDNPSKRRVSGLPVFGRTSELRRVALDQGVDAVVLAIPSLPDEEFRELAEVAAKLGIGIRYLPSFLAAVERDARASDLRSLRVDRLLGRPEQRVARWDSSAAVEGKRVLVTGAGGSIGSELCRQISRYEPEALYLLDHDESNLHTLLMELQGQALGDEQILIADIRDERRIRQLVGELRPHVIFHAAAHKHLPLLERHPCEGVKTNVLGTEHLASAAAEVGVERFILISTDKAADPTSVLGATKRVAEMIVREHANDRTMFASVRFGNVLGSRGSLLSVLSGQVLNRQAFTVTHPDVSRFFMTIEEAVGLVIEAANLARGGETFVLDMGKPVRIVDLVQSYAAQMHLPKESVSIRYTGLRPGEKLSESLFGTDEERRATAHPSISAAISPPLPRDFSRLLDDLAYAAQVNRAEDVRRSLAALVTNYTPAAPSVESVLIPAPYPDGF